MLSCAVQQQSCHFSGMPGLSRQLVSPTLTASHVQGYTVAIRMLLHDDNSASMTLFFGFVGALNAACLAPVLLGLQLAGLVDVLGMSARVLLLTISKGVTAETARFPCMLVATAFFKIDTVLLTQGECPPALVPHFLLASINNHQCMPCDVSCT